ncbi:MAG: DHH family phosphoesterase, partial [Anaerovoracaceae bacterium]|nr:DHH family phosphoesterase [Anaerovoracaceae bacterium]
TVEKSNKGKSRIVGHALTQLILQAPKIFIMGHVHSDMDSFGATLGIARLCMVNGKKPYIVIEDPNESLETVFNLAKDTEKYGFINCDKATDLCTEDSLVIVVDTHKKDIVQCPELLGISRKVVVIDHHRKADKGIEDPVLNYMESYASSACEMVTEILQFMLQKKKQMEKIEAEALMAGIMVDSSFFSVRAGVRTFEAAAWLRRQGADPTEVKRFFQEDWENVKIKSKALLDADILNHGIAMASLPGERGDAQLLCAQLADRLLSLKGVRASFACGRDSEQRTVISARSLGAVNVQVIMEKLGGGGHLTNAAAQVSIPVEEALEKIRILTEETIK